MSRYKKIVLLHSNDMHGDFLAEDIDDRLVGGVSMLSGYVDKVRKEEPNTLYCIAGDMFRGSVIDSEYKGLSTIEIMNALAPDAVAMGVALWPDIVEDYVDAYCYCCTKEEPAYGQVIIYDVNQPLSIDYKIPPANAQVIRRINYQEFKNRFKASLARL